MPRVPPLPPDNVNHLSTNRPIERNTLSAPAEIPWSQDENPPPSHHSLSDFPGEKQPCPEPVYSLRGPNPVPLLSWLVILVSFVSILIIMRIPPSPPNAGSFPNASTPAIADALAALKDPQEEVLAFAFEIGARIVPTNPDLNSKEFEQQFGIYRNEQFEPEMQLRLAIVDIFQAADAEDLITKRFLTARAQHEKRMQDIPHGEWPAWALEFEAVLNVAEALHRQDRAPTPAEADLLIHNLRSFGELIVAHYEGPNSPAQQSLNRKAVRVVLAFLFLFFGLLGGLLLGLILFCVATSRLVQGRIIFRLNPQRLFSTQSADLFLEAFAVYFGLIVFVTLLIQAGGSSNGIASILPIIAGSIGGTAWPFLRGLPIKRAAFELGLARGQGIFKEIIAGIAGYLALIPLYLLGIGVSIILLVFQANFSAQFGGAPTPGEMSHPIIKPLLRGDLWLKLVIFGFAAGFAPFFEETLFRGAFYAALRKRLPIPMAAIIMAFIFAAIHPQGFAAIPVLMSLAISFALLREWRGSLIAPMAAHALHNGFLVGIIILII